MKKNEEKEKFIELRAQGWSFSRIAEQTGVSKPILIKWNAEFSKEISNHRFLVSEAVLEKYRLMKVGRLEIFANVLNEALQELQQR